MGPKSENLSAWPLKTLSGVLLINSLLNFYQGLRISGGSRVSFQAELLGSLPLFSFSHSLWIAGLFSQAQWKWF